MIDNIFGLIFITLPFLLNLSIMVFVNRYAVNKFEKYTLPKFVIICATSCIPFFGYLLLIACSVDAWDTDYNFDFTFARHIPFEKD